MGYGKRFRNFARNTAAYTSGYILGGHAGGFAAYKGAEYLDNSLQKMRQTRSMSKRTPTFRSIRGPKNLKNVGRTKVIGRKRMGSTPTTLAKKFKMSKGSGPKEIAGHNDMAVKKFSIKLSRRKPKFSNTVGRYIFQETWDGAHQTEEGKQNITLCKALMTSTQLIGDTLQTLRDEKTTWAIAPTTLNPYNLITNAIYTSSYTANDSFFIANVQSQLGLISCCSIPQKVKIMWLMYKKHSNQTVDAVWDDAITYENMNQAAGTYASSPAVLSANAGAATKLFVEYNPFSLKTFRQTFKCLHKEEFVLQPGDQKHFKASINVQKRFDMSYLKTIGTKSNDTYLGGITIVPVIIGYGGLVSVQKSSKLDTTYGIAAAGIMQNNKYTFKAVRADRMSTSRSYAGHPSAVFADLDDKSIITTREFTINVTDDPIANKII